MNLAKDLVFGMEVDAGFAKYKTKYGGTTYYFCALGCQKVFTLDPEKYLKQ
jgi:YHS domain-containing protein